MVGAVNGIRVAFASRTPAAGRGRGLRAGSGHATLGSKEMPQESYPITMREIAREAGVSVSAVSLALRNSPKVSQERRETILATARRLGYRPDPRLSELMEHLRTTRPRRGPSRIALLVPEVGGDSELAGYAMLSELVAGVREMADYAGFGVDTFFLGEPGMTPRRARGIVMARGIRGVVITPFRRGVAEVDLDVSGLCVATAGYSIVSPRLHRACPNYLQMMDELVAACRDAGRERVGLVMTYHEGGIGHKLFTSSFLFFQAHLRPEERIPILGEPDITPQKVREWMERHRPDVIISSGAVYEMLRGLGLRIPEDIGFLNIDISEEPRSAAGADHRFRLVGRETLKLVVEMLNLNLAGPPEDPKVVLVDSHRRSGFTLPPRGAVSERRGMAAKRRTKVNH